MMMRSGVLENYWKTNIPIPNITRAINEFLNMVLKHSRTTERIRKPLSLGIIFILLASTLLTFTPAKASTTIFIRADGSVDPPTDLFQRPIILLTSSLLTFPVLS